MLTSLHWFACLGLLLVSLVCATEASAEMDKDNQGRWAKPTESGPDKEVPGFLVNLGPTGARAILTEKTLIVRYIFKETPAEGHLKMDDVITGIAGTPFTSYVFGGSPHGYEGPIMSFGEAIEHAEGTTGQMVLNVVRAGKPTDVVIHLEPIGTFSASFPVQCAKSTLLQSRALAYLAAHPESFQGPAHAKATVALALLTSGNPQQIAAGKSIILGWNAPPSPDTWTWGVSYQIIALSEYHLLTGDPAVLPTIAAAAKILRQDQYAGKILIWGPKGDKYLEKVDYSKVDAAQQLYEGGFGHTPYIPGVGKDGYGPMQFTTILAVIAWQLAERCGVAVDPQGLSSALDFIHHGTNEAGYVAYGGEFTLNAGLVDPVTWKQSTEGTDYVGRAGASLIAHSLSPEFPLSDHYIDKNRRYMKTAYKSLPDGHADPMLGFCWGLLGTGAAGDEDLLRTMMEYHKALFNMMRCADGSFVVLPGRNYADGGYYISSRYYPTAIMALTFGLGNPKLMIQGIQVTIPGINVKALKGKLQAAYKAIVAKVYAEAVRLLAAVRAAKTTSVDDAAAGQALSLAIDQRLAKELATLDTCEQRGDFFAANVGLVQARANFGGLEGFKDKIRPIEEALQREPGKTQVKLGAHFVQLVANLRRLRTLASVGDLEKFADKNPEGLYARWAREIATAFRVDRSIIDPATIPALLSTTPSPSAAGGVAAP